jgi:type I restriction enzyme S subunit
MVVQTNDKSGTMIQNNNIPQGYKDSPMGIIPEGGGVKRLGEIFSFKNGINSNKESYGKGIKFVNTLDVLNNNYIYSNILKGSITIDEKQKREFIVQQGDILFNRTSETKEDVGHSTVFDDENEVVFGGFIIRAHSLNNLLDIKFKRYCFKPDNIRKQIIAYGNGAIRYNIGQEDIAKVKIAIPPLSEQQKIAEILTVWDNAIDIQIQLIASLQKRKQGLMQQLLTGKKRLKGFEGEWKEVTIGDVSEIKKGKALTSDQIIDGIYPVIAGGKTSPYSHNEYTDENVITISASGAYAGYVSYHTNKIWASDCSVLYAKMGNDTIYIYYLLIYNQEFIYLLQSGGAQPHIFPKDIAVIKCKIPPIEEQTAIANILSSADKEINLAKKKLTALKGQKKGLMQQLLTGKKRVKI